MVKTPSLDLSQLILKCKKKDRQAQHALFMHYKDALFVTSLKYCSNKAEAEDNLHDAFLTIFQKIKTYKGRGSFEGWMQRITINQAINKFKASKKNILTPDQSYLKEDGTATSQELKVPLDDILSIIQELPDQYRMVFNLYELDDYTHREIANMLSISEGTSKSNLHRAKQILKGRLLEFKQKNINV